MACLFIHQRILGDNIGLKYWDFKNLRKIVFILVSRLRFGEFELLLVFVIISKSG